MPFLHQPAMAGAEQQTEWSADDDERADAELAEAVIAASSIASSVGARKRRQRKPAPE